MGIKGIYRELGPATRVSLCKLAVDNLEQTGRPFRLAVDISIWQFQVQAAKGGANPAIRTLFYRLVRLLGLAIEPVFVFDGPKKPAFKRNKRTGGRGDTVATAMAKRLIKLFGFQIHDAPGEAEAECALLQQQGAVDAVLSEDVDTIMFGCTRTLRNWSAEGARGGKAPTHVSVYEAEELGRGEFGLDREGMVLVALMSGGDYLPEGIPGCGVRVACEAAKAGFGRSLCRLKKADTAALAAWKDKLAHELRTNESGFFRTRHKALVIPESFPNLDILRYYTHPVVSQPAAVERVKERFRSGRPHVDVCGLRAFAGETFDWENKVGAVKLIRVLAPSLLVQSLLFLSDKQEERSGDTQETQREEAKLVRAISSRRSHFSTDATPELRVSYVPADIVPLDLAQEGEAAEVVYGRTGLALNSDDEMGEQVDGATDGAPSGAAPRKVFDPLQPDLVWVPESVVKLGVPLAVEDWEEKQRSKELGRTAAAKAPKRRAKKADMAPGALDRWVHVSKNIAPLTKSAPAPAPHSPARPMPVATISLMSNPGGAAAAAAAAAQARGPARKPPAATRSKKPKQKGQDAAGRQTNPWTIAGSQASPRGTEPVQPREPIVISSSPAGPPSSPPLPRLKHVGSPPPENSFTPDPFGSPPRSPRKQRPPPRGGDVGPAGPAAGAAPGKPPPTRGRPRDALPGPQTSIERYYGSLSKPGAARAGGLDKPPPPRRPPACRPGAAYQVIDSDSDSDDLGNLDGIRLRQKAVAAAGGDADPFGPAAPPARLGGGAPSEEDGRDGPRRTGPATTRLYIPRTSDAGFLREVEVAREEADRLIREHARSAAAGGGAPAGRGILRQSDVSILDLTGED